MIGRMQRTRRIERDLAALADGSLPPRRRARVERELAASPDLQAELHEQRRALAAVQAVETVRAPASLRMSVAASRPGHARHRTFGALAVAGVAALAVAVVLTLGGGGAGTAPTAADAAVLATRPPAAAIPVAAHGRSELALPRAAGLRFPYWADRFGWKAIGWRRDTLDGRSATTVYYRYRGKVVAYTIVGGTALAVGAPAHVSHLGGTTLRDLTAARRNTVTWLRHGHTCVLSGSGVASQALLRLAAWQEGRGISD